MTEPKWTPGPWKTDPEVGRQAVLGPDGFMAADCAIVSLRAGAPTDETCTANAHLIAAAPDMYAALFGLYNVCAAEQYENDPGAPPILKDGIRDKWMAGAAEVLARARGES